MVSREDVVIQKLERENERLRDRIRQLEGELAKQSYTVTVAHSQRDRW
jgi:hypothetical protein